MKSEYGDRETVGSIYINAQKNNTETHIINGDLTHEIQKSLVEDINKCIESKPYEGRSFYLTVHEKKDLMMPKAILRRMITTLYRPWPEDDTLVFFVDTKANEVRFCWCLPHHTAMYNILANEELYDKQYVQDIKEWKAFNMHHFGFCKDELGNWTYNPNFKDREMKKKLKNPLILSANNPFKKNEG